MTTSELAKVYEPAAVEPEINNAWQAAGAHTADPAAGKPTFSLVIPPPNVTAALHLGHALNNTLQDILTRYRRMQQHNTLWMPGTDHAGIATQTVVEKRLLGEEGKRRTDYGREEFVGKVRAWKDEYEARILGQLKRMGCSCDWSRTRFTMDDVCARAVRETFLKLFADGLIYRGKRLVNWDPATQTVLADDEVEHETVEGHFWYLRYPLTEPAVIDGQSFQYVVVATTRPKTSLGDTAVAMNPADPRAGELIGRTVRLPIVGREIPIVADDLVVLPDPESDDEKARFSTGFLKVTPAHDPNDWAIGQRHDLEVINVMAPDGSISDAYGWDDCSTDTARGLLGRDRFEARQAIVDHLRNEGLLEKVRDYTHEVGHSYRSHVPIEPYLSDQWYVAVKRQVPTLPDEGLIHGTDVPVNSLAGLALRPLLDGRLTFVPERYARTYQNWLENLRDWPISRQLWWGHQIPVWSRELNLPGDIPAEPTDRGPDARVCAALDAAMGQPFREALADSPVRYEPRSGPAEDDPADKAMAYICLDTDDPQAVQRIEAAGFVRDPDVLDTWFSSALWPFSTLGWPGETEELKTYYPTDVLCTAREIITLWVSRMVMMGQYALGDIPFSDVFIHAMIQDGEGQKMSKSLGNGVDPTDIIESHGADAMRFTLASMTTQTQDVRMPVDTICPWTGQEFAPKMITTAAGVKVAAPIQDSPFAEGKKMVTSFGVASGQATPSEEMPLAKNTSPKFDLGRNFCNKLWNASRFVIMNLAGCPAFDDADPAAELADRWILSRLTATVAEVTGNLNAYRFNDVAQSLYHFTWDDFCDWYVEVAKGRIRAGDDSPKPVLAHCLDTILRLLHPVAPFITEAIWQRLNAAVPSRGPGGQAAPELLMTAEWPAEQPARADTEAERGFAVLQEIVRGIRNARNQQNVPPSQPVDAIFCAEGEAATAIEANVPLLKHLANLGEVTVSREAVEPPADASALTAAGVQAYLLGVVDRQAEVHRLTKQQATLLKGIRGIQGKLGNESFLTKAPDNVVQRERQRLAQLQDELKSVENLLAQLQ